MTKRSLYDDTYGMLVGDFKPVTLKQIEVSYEECLGQLAGDEDLELKVCLCNGEVIQVESLEGKDANLVVARGVDKSGRKAIALLSTVGLQVVMTVVKRPKNQSVSFLETKSSG